jgi:hypothetical protein
MLDIVAANQHQAAAAIDRGGIDDGKTRHPTARRIRTEPVAAEPAHQPCREADQNQHEHEGKNESDRLLHPKIPRQTLTGSARAPDAWGSAIEPGRTTREPRLACNAPAETADG